MANFIKVGDMVFNANNITAVNLDDVHGYITVGTSAGADGDGYTLPSESPATQAFIAWLTDPDRCIDVMTIEPDAPNVLETPFGIRFEV